MQAGHFLSVGLLSRPHIGHVFQHSDLKNPKIIMEKHNFEFAECWLPSALKHGPAPALVVYTPQRHVSQKINLCIFCFADEGLELSL